VRSVETTFYVWYNSIRLQNKQQRRCSSSPVILYSRQIIPEIRVLIKSYNKKKPSPSIITPFRCTSMNNAKTGAENNTSRRESSGGRRGVDFPLKTIIISGDA